MQMLDTWGHGLIPGMHAVKSSKLELIMHH